MNNSNRNTTSIGGHKDRSVIRLRRGLLAVVLAGTVVLVPSAASRTAAQANPPHAVETQALTRVLDTRTSAALQAGSTIVVPTGQPGAHAVGVNLTIAGSSGPGFITAWASGPRPETSALNADKAGATVANYLIVPVEADGTFLLYTSVTTDVIVDLMTRFNSVDAVTVPGPSGPSGPIGDPGPIGPTGPQGDIGPAGPAGPQGDIGPIGPAGPIGPIGLTGPAGPQGDIGPAGPAGPQGDIGPAGPIGLTGATGPTGATGATGPTGATGATGANGPIGATGAQGAVGTPGATVLASTPGLYVDNTLGATTTVTRALANDRIELVPFATAVSLTVDLAGISVATGAAGNARVLVYSSAATGWPDQLLLQTTNLSTVTAAFVSAPVTFTFQPGRRYWVGVHSASAAAIRTLPLSSAVPLGVITPDATTYASVIRRTSTFTTPPTTWAFVIGDLVPNTTPPSIRFRAA